MKSLRLALTLAAAVAFCAAPALAGTVKFPKTEPILSFDLPDEWRAEPDEKGNLKVQPAGDDEFVLLVGKLAGAKDMDDARKALPIVARKSCEGTGVKAVEVTEVKTAKGLGKKSDLALSACEARGKDGSGNEYVVTAASLEADGEIVIFVSVTTAAKDKKYTPAMEKILDSMEEVH